MSKLSTGTFDRDLVNVVLAKISIANYFPLWSVCPYGNGYLHDFASRGAISRYNRLILGHCTSRICPNLLSITRKRVTKENTEESIIDHLIISEDLKDFLEKLLVDEEREHELTKVMKNKGRNNTVLSDHNPMISNFTLKWNRKKKSKKIEMFNLKNNDGQSKFKNFTNTGICLSEVFDSNEDLNICTDKFIKRLNQVIRKSFKKIRICDRPDKEVNELFEKRKALRNKTDEHSKVELENVEKKLSDKCAENNYKKIKEELANIKVEEGGIHSGSLWQLKKKLSPKCRDPPTAMLDQEGNLQTSPEVIEKLALQTYKLRLQNREMREELTHIKNDKEELCQLRLKMAQQKKTPPWTLQNLEVVLKYLKM